MTPRRPSPPARRPAAGGPVGTLGPRPEDPGRSDAGAQIARDLAARLTKRPEAAPVGLRTAAKPAFTAGDGGTGRDAGAAARPERRRSASARAAGTPAVRRVPRRPQAPSGPIWRESVPQRYGSNPKTGPKPIGVRAARSHVLAPPLPPLPPLPPRPPRATTSRPTKAKPVGNPPVAKRLPARPTTAGPTTPRPTTAGPTTPRPASTPPVAKRRPARPTAAGPTTPRPTTPRPVGNRPVAKRLPARPSTAAPTNARRAAARAVTAGTAFTRLAAPLTRLRTPPVTTRPGGTRRGDATRRRKGDVGTVATPVGGAGRRLVRPKAAALSDAVAPTKLVVAGTRESGWVLLATITALLIVMGLMMVLSASSVEALRSYGGAWVFFQKQAIWVVVGTAAMVASSCWDYRRWARLAWPLVVASLVLLLALNIPGVGIDVSGSTRWLGFGAFRFQPSELAKFALLVFVADLLARRSDRMHESRLTLRPVVVVAGLLGGLVLLQPDMGTAMVMVLIVLVELFVAGLPLIRMAAVCLTSTVGACILAMGAGYRRNRVFGFVDPWGDVSNTGYQVAQSLVALGTGHLAGVGLGASRAKWGFLPNAHTDFIFAIVGEELGLVGTLLVLGLFAAFAVLGVRTALRAPDRFGLLMAAGITTWVVGQALVNMGAVTGLLPVTGVPLPFLSFGGTALVVTMAATGILLNIARHAVPRPR